MAVASLQRLDGHLLGHLGRTECGQMMALIRFLQLKLTFGKPNQARNDELAMYAVEDMTRNAPPSRIRRRTYTKADDWDFVSRDHLLGGLKRGKRHGV